MIMLRCYQLLYLYIHAAQEEVSLYCTVTTLVISENHPGWVLSDSINESFEQAAGGNFDSLMQYKSFPLTVCSKIPRDRLDHCNVYLQIRLDE